MALSIEQARVAVNTMRARLTILGFNLVIITFQINNTRGLGGGTHLEGFETTVHLSTGVVLLTGLALSISSMVVFIASTMHDSQGTSDGRMLLAGDVLMYLALSQTVSGFFSSYDRVLALLSVSAGAEQAAWSDIHVSLSLAGSTAWILATYVGPAASLVRSHLGGITKLLHAIGYAGILVFISRLWWAAQQIEGSVAVSDCSLSKWINAFAAPLYW